MFWLLAVLDYTIFWVLIVRFPAVMVVVACGAFALSMYLRQRAASVRDFLLDMNHHPPEQEWIDKWLSSWIATSLFGIAMAFYLLH